MTARKVTRRPKARKSRKPDDGRVTVSQQRNARAWAIREGAFQRPYNCLVDRNPIETTAACRRVIDYLAHIECPFESEELDAAEADILHMVTDALKHVEKSVGNFFAAEPTAAAAKEVQS